MREFKRLAALTSRVWLILGAILYWALLFFPHLRAPGVTHHEALTWFFIWLVGLLVSIAQWGINAED